MGSDGNPEAATCENAVPVEAAAGSDGNPDAATGENVVPAGTGAGSDGIEDAATGDNAVRVRTAAGSDGNEDAGTDDNALPVESMGMSDFPLGTFRETFWCTDCKQECGLARAKRMMSKSKGSSRCVSCNANHAKLYRGFCKWPTMEFQGLSIDVQE